MISIRGNFNYRATEKQQNVKKLDPRNDAFTLRQTNFSVENIHLKQNKLSYCQLKVIFSTPLESHIGFFHQRSFDKLKKSLINWIVLLKYHILLFREVLSKLCNFMIKA